LLHIIQSTQLKSLS